ncbi:ATP-binding protein [Brachyspira hyodysenteriae]|nr:AAA family ATPase [Brachyspira hyodysenteriae]MCZ9891795.1 ATP-binding protein [Brachyspira hyodysenteriae]MCZ9989348.1 ATP-binding protein [Brachyspira hyodysenteriae]MCZ9997707.1 ATP-binding protein [Brachyspira hyodysenteriae]MDA0001148.1 ATP-binding protein [Brachyspira hyodysenteriae]MDA0006157.1 ATP-binding protein [Brachyspira hyodysenteriae]
MGLKLEFIKFENITFEFNKNINIIAGVNGTCKSSLLYVISNSFKKIDKNFEYLKDKQFITITNKITKEINPKLEKLVKNSKYYNDPAKNTKGILYNIISNNKLGFRKHNSKKANRYAVKPYYKIKNKESLEYKFIIYLGLSRLLPYGEYYDDSLISKINVDLPEKYKNSIKELYKEFTNFDIDYQYNEVVSNIKNRGDFYTNIEGIDSNTISAGEDNLFIVLQSLVSFEYYYDSLNKDYIDKEEFVSIFLIDELDATLHPNYQNKLLDKLEEYSKKYKIKVIFTTHSLSLIEYSLDKKEQINIIYLQDKNNKVDKLDNSNIYKMKQHLLNIGRKKMFENVRINIFTEDEEARIFLNILFDFFEKKYGDSFSYIRDKFFLLEMSIGSSNLAKLFNKENFQNEHYLGICILDGDQENDIKDKRGNCILCLPGGKSPEKLFFEYIEVIINNYESYSTKCNISQEYSKDDLKEIFNSYKNIQLKKVEEKSKNNSSKGVEREELKKHFNRYEKHYKYFFELWIKENEEEVNKFYKELNVLFKKVAHFFGIDRNEWNIEDNKGD